MIGIIIKKEITALVKKKQLLVLVIAFAILGIMSPLLALFLPDILSSALPPELIGSIPDSTSIDAWGQFYNNINQIGFLVIIIIFIGIVSSEVEKGTLIPLITKGLNRKYVIIGKLITMLLVWTICFIISLGISYAYTSYYFNDSLSAHVIESTLYLYIFGIFLLSVVLFASTVGKSTISSLLVLFGIIVVGLISNMFTMIMKYNPFSLASQNMNIINNQLNYLDVLPAVGISLLLTISLIVISISIFDKKTI